jgi:glycerol-1-phosphate dehydrogenase [NAD(P)+]
MQPSLTKYIPNVVRLKEGAVNRLGIYLNRALHYQVIVVYSDGLISSIVDDARNGLDSKAIQVAQWYTVGDNCVETAQRIIDAPRKAVDAVVGIGGGKALDIAKYAADRMQLPYWAVPTSLSNDGFCSPQSSLTVDGIRTSFKTVMPFGLVIDSTVCRAAPRILTISGIGDLVAKFTAVQDWKLAFRAQGEPINDFAALLSDGSVHAFLSVSSFDSEGIRLLATALMMNGVSMSLAGSSRPASGSEHLISHALDRLSAKPRLHGLQVGMATYIVSRLQGEHTDRIRTLFDEIGFWDAIACSPFSKTEWLEAVRMAPSIKENYYTVLATRDVLPEVRRIIDADPTLERCFA